VVQAGSRAFTVSQNNVAYFALFEKHTFLVTTNGKQYLYNSSLEKIGGMVSPIIFFQLNRQVLANRNSIKAFHQTETRRLLVELNPPFGKPVYIAKTKAAKFTGWLSQS
jgi:DNA-binding LytR/AlgR family response regulator